MRNALWELWAGAPRGRPQFPQRSMQLVADRSAYCDVDCALVPGEVNYAAHPPCDRLSVRVLFLGAFACACNSSAKTLPDADRVKDAFDCWSSGDICNVLNQTGCCTGWKCTWLEDGMQLGHIDCVPDGAISIGSACGYSQTNPHGSLFDACVPGSVCLDGTCRAICDQAGGAPMCGSGFGCKVYDGFFGPAGMVVAAGVCVERCDPFDDNDFLGSGTKSGSTCTAQQGCFALPNQGVAADPTVWSCDPEVHPTLVHRSAAGALPVAADSCAQGYEPIYVDADGSTQVDCIALCAPLDCYAGNCGSNSANLGGAEPHACNGSDARGTFNVATAANNGDQCMYSWLFEITPGEQHIPSATSNTVGFCIDHSRYGMPSCDTLPLGSGSQSASAYGCVSTSLAGLPVRTNLRLGRHR